MTSYALFWILKMSILLFFGAHAKSNELICRFTKRIRAGETRQGRFRRFGEDIAQFVDGILNCWACTRH